jgi:hypothetical protein
MEKKGGVEVIHVRQHYIKTIIDTGTSVRQKVKWYL